MDRESILRRYSKLLERYGFSETYAYGMRSCLDIISRKRDKVMILKFVDNIDSLSTQEASTLKKLNNFFDAEVFVVFRSYKGGKAEKGMMFTRHGIDCLSHDAFESVLSGNVIPRAQKFIKAKYKIDSNELKNLRKLQDISMQTLSEAVKISKDTIYRYEKGMGFATAPNVKKLKSFFKTNIVEIADNSKKIDTNYKYHRINKALDIDFIDVQSSPFYMLGKKHSRYEMASEGNVRTTKKIAEFYKGFSDVMNDDYPFFIAFKEKSKDNFYGIPVLTKEELQKIKDEKELIEMITSRKKN